MKRQKKRKFRLKFYIFLLLIGVFIFILNNPQYLLPQIGNGMKVVIDPGHGGVDPGTIQGEIYEKDLNLAIAKLLEKYLNHSGFTVVMTRDDDRFLSLRRRTEIVNQEKPELFISIHANSNPVSSLKGTEIYWNNSKSENFAQKMYESFLYNLGAEANRGIFNKRYYVIRNTDVPSILVEVGYLTNRIERYELLETERQKLIAKAIARGVIRFVETQ